MPVKVTLGKFDVHQLLANDNRNVKDGKYIAVFWAILLIWMISCGYVIYCTVNNQSHSKIIFDLKNDLEQISTAEDLAKNHSISIKFYCHDNINLILLSKKTASVFIWMSLISYSSLLMGVILLIHQIALWKLPGLIIISFTLIITTIFYRVIMYYFNVVQQLELMHTKIIYKILPDAVIFIFSFLVLMSFTHSKKIATVDSMWKKTFKYYCTFPILFMVGSGTCIAIVISNSITKEVLLSLECLMAKSVASEVVYWIIYSGHVYIIVLINILGRMIISATAANYWNKKSRQSPMRLIKVQFQKIDDIFSYQLGSACYKATYTSVWFTVLTGPLMGCDFVNSKVAEMCLIVLLLMLTVDYAVLLIAILDLRASEARRQVVRSFVKFPKKLAFMCQNLPSTTFLIFLSKSYFMLTLMWGLYECDVEIKKLSFEITLVVLPMIIVLGTMEDTRSICIIRKNAEKEAAICTIMDAEKLGTTDEKSAKEPTQMIDRLQYQIGFKSES